MVEECGAPRTGPLADAERVVADAGNWDAKKVRTNSRIHSLTEDSWMTDSAEIRSVTNSRRTMEDILID